MPGLSETPAFLPSRADVLQRAVKMRSGFSVHGDEIGARLGESPDIGVDRFDHQMRVERAGGVWAQRLHDSRAEGDVGHEMAVHHVEMKPIGAGGDDIAHFLAEPGEIRGENRWGDDNVGVHAPCSDLTEPLSATCEARLPASRRRDMRIELAGGVALGHLAERYGLDLRRLSRRAKLLVALHADLAHRFLRGL